MYKTLCVCRAPASLCDCLHYLHVINSNLYSNIKIYSQWIFFQSWLAYVPVFVFTYWCYVKGSENKEKKETIPKLPYYFFLNIASDIFNAPELRVSNKSCTAEGNVYLDVSLSSDTHRNRPSAAVSRYISNRQNL